MILILVFRETSPKVKVINNFFVFFFSFQPMSSALKGQRNSRILQYFNAFCFNFYQKKKVLKSLQ